MNVGGLCIGFELVMLTLLAKLYRVKTLAFAKANKKVKVTDGFLLVRIAVAMVLLIIYLGAASWIERIKLLNRVTEDVMRTDSKGTKYYYEIQACSYFETIVWLPLYFMQLVLIFLVAIMAFQTRKLSTAFSEVGDILRGAKRRGRAKRGCVDHSIILISNTAHLARLTNSTVPEHLPRNK